MIIGDAFHPVVHANYDDESKAWTDTQFTARLGEVALKNVTFINKTRLSAEVPAILSPGTYDLVVIDPANRKGTLVGAFTVNGPHDGAVDGIDAGVDAAPDLPAMDRPTEGLLTDLPPLDQTLDQLPDQMAPDLMADAGPDLPQPDMKQPDQKVFDLQQPDMHQTDTQQPDMAQPDIPQPDMPPPDMAQPDMAQPDMPQPDMAQPDMAQPDMPQPDMAQPDMAQPDMQQPDMQQPDMQQPDTQQPDQSKPDAPAPDQSIGTSYGQAIWGRKGNTAPYANLWKGIGFSGPQPTTQVARWRIMAGAAASTRSEAIVIGVDSGHLITGARGPVTWTPLSINQLNTNKVSETYWWQFAVAYEGLSDHALVVFNNNVSGALLGYMVWNGSSWTSKGVAAAYAGDEPQQLRMAVKPGGDEMVLVISDRQADDHALVWNGSSWGNAVTLDTSGTAESDQTAVNVAYEHNTGRAMVAYGKNNHAKLYYKIWNGSAWSTSTTSVSPPTGVAAQTGWSFLAADPGSNRIAAAVLTTGGTNADVWLAVWDGSTWGSVALAETTATGSIFPGAAVAFEAVSGQALATYGQNNQTVVRYRTWSSGGGWSGEQLGPSIGEEPNSMTLSPAPASDEVMLAVQNDNNELNYVKWDGSSWGASNQLEKDTDEDKNQPFLFLWYPWLP